MYKSVKCKLVYKYNYLYIHTIHYMKYKRERINHYHIQAQAYA